MDTLPIKIGYYLHMCSHQQLSTEDLQQSGEHVSIPQVVVQVRYATGHSGQMGVNPLGKSLLLHRITFI